MLVIGNGESRLGIDIDSINMPKVGCNAILRDYRVDHLICVDRKMVKEAITSNYHLNCPVYTREDWIREFVNYPNIHTVPKLPYVGFERPDEPFNWGSGPYAVLLATKYSKNIKLLGFDLYSENGKLNNLYKDTQNYMSSNHRVIDPKYWIYQIAKIFETFRTHQFTIYQTNWELPKLWKLANVVVDKPSKLIYN